MRIAVMLAAVALAGCGDEVADDWARRAQVLEAHAADGRALLADLPGARQREQAARAVFERFRPVTPAELVAVLGEGVEARVEVGGSFGVLKAHLAGTGEVAAAALQRAAVFGERLVPIGVTAEGGGYTLELGSPLVGTPSLPAVPPAPRGECPGRCAEAKERARAAEAGWLQVREALGPLAVLASLEGMAARAERNHKMFANPWLASMQTVLRAAGTAPTWQRMQASSGELRLALPQ